MACACQKYKNRVIRTYGTRVELKGKSKKKILLKDKLKTIIFFMPFIITAVIATPIIIFYLIYKMGFKGERNLNIMEFLNLIRFKKYNARR